MSLEQLKELRKKKKSMLEEIRREASQVFSEESKALFEKYPELNNFGWTQYTPYFNDGDVCEFSCNSGYPTINDYDEDSGDGEKLTPDMNKAVKAVKEFLNSFEDEEMEFIFGDHVKVTVTRSGATTDQYDHD